MEDQHKAENTFSADEASSIVKECVDVILGGVDYDEGRVNEWMSAVVEQSLTHLVQTIGLNHQLASYFMTSNSKISLPYFSALTPATVIEAKQASVTSIPAFHVM